MIFSTITQNKLELTADTTVIPAQFSSNIELQFIQDDVNFPGYSVSASASVYDTKIIECADILNAGGTIAVNPDGTFAVPSSVLDQSGYLAIAFTLTSGNENVVLAPVVYKINISIKTISPLPPSTDEWQQIVEAYVNTFLTNNVPTKAEIQVVEDSVNNIINGTTAVGNAQKLGGTVASKYVTNTTLNNYCPYRVGDIYITTNSANPSTIWSGTTWVQWGEGRVPVGVNTSDSDFNTVEKTGGEKTHKLTINEIPSHSHADAKPQTIQNTATGSSKYGYLANGAFNATANTGGDQAHNNLQPYITCYMWKRTA